MTTPHYRDPWIEAARKRKETRRRARDEKVDRRCACKAHAALGRRGVFAIDGNGIAHSTRECFLFSKGPQKTRHGAWGVL